MTSPGPTDELRLDQEHYDVIVQGTGVVNVMTSALLASYGLSVLHLDRASEYGGADATVSFEQAVEFARNRHRDVQVETSEKSLRGYLLDLSGPCLLMSRGKSVALMLQLGTGHYMSFQSVPRLLTVYQESIRTVPVSKQHIFACEFMRKQDKRRLMKLLHLILSESNDDEDPDRDRFSRLPSNQPGTQSESCSANEETFASYLDSVGISPDLKDLLMFSICQVASTEESLQLTKSSAINLISLFVRSIGRFDATGGLLYPLYGFGDICQAFARSSAIRGTTFMLNQHIERVISVDQDKISVLMSRTHQLITAHRLVTDHDHFRIMSATTEQGAILNNSSKNDRPIDNPNDANETLIPTQDSATALFTCDSVPGSYRLICILSSPLMELDNNATSLFALSIPPNFSIIDNPHTVRIVQVDSSTGCAPPGAAILYLDTLYQDGVNPLPAAVQYLIDHHSSGQNQHLLVASLSFTEMLSSIDECFTPNPCSSERIFVVPTARSRAFVDEHWVQAAQNLAAGIAGPDRSIQAFDQGDDERDRDSVNNPDFDLIRTDQYI